MRKDESGHVWLGTWGQGLIQYNGSSFRTYNKANGLDEDVITCLNTDRDGNVWIGSYNNGLFFYGGNEFVALSEQDGLVDNTSRD
jgi:ligand-binding sensor domain-containing protein